MPLTDNKQAKINALRKIMKDKRTKPELRMEAIKMFATLTDAPIANNEKSPPPEASTSLSSLLLSTDKSKT